jgi:hypothetical protein
MLCLLLLQCRNGTACFRCCATAKRHATRAKATLPVSFDLRERFRYCLHLLLLLLPLQPPLVLPLQLLLLSRGLIHLQLLVLPIRNGQSLLGTVVLLLLLGAAEPGLHQVHAAQVALQCQRHNTR